MPEENIGTPEPSAPAAQPSAPQVDWESRYKGLDKKYQTDREAWNSKANLLVNAMSEIEGFKQAVAAKEKEAITYKTQFEQTTAELQKAQAETAKFQSQLSRVQKIAQVNPTLLALDAKGLLRQDLQGEQLDAYLKDFVDTLSDAGTGNIKQYLAGASTPPPTKDAGNDPDALLAQMDKLLSAGKFAEWEALNEKYIASLSR